MNPLLLAILGTPAHADGETPTLDPPVAQPAEVSGVGPCRDAAKPGVDRLNHPYSQDNQIVVDAEKRCVASGQRHCDASRVLSQQIAICLAGLPQHSEVRLDDAGYGITVGHPSATGLVWKVSFSDGSRGSAVFVDAMTGEHFGLRKWVGGRPLRQGGRSFRAHAVRRADWSRA